MWSSGISRDAVVLLLLVNYLILVVIKRYSKYRNYRFYPTDLTFGKYLKRNIFSLPVLFYSMLLLFAELTVLQALTYD